MGPTLGSLRGREFSVFWRYCHSGGVGYSFHSVRAALDGMEIVSTSLGRDPVLHSLAGRISVPWVVAEYSVQIGQERCGWLVDGIRTFWLFTYHKYGVPELALCDF